MGGLPREFLRELCESMVNLVLVLTFSDDDGASGLFSRGEVWERKDCSRKEGGFIEEVTT